MWYILRRAWWLASSLAAQFQIVRREMSMVIWSVRTSTSALVASHDGFHICTEEAVFPPLPSPPLPLMQHDEMVSRCFVGVEVFLFCKFPH
jgi:hypothetical protein